MALRWARCAVVLAALAVALLGAGKARAQGADDLVALQRQVSELLGRGNYAEAAPIAEHYVALVRQSYGEQNVAFAAALSWLGTIYQSLGRLAEAESLFKRSLALAQTVLPAGHIGIAHSLNNLANLYQAQGRFAEAEPLFKRALILKEAALPAGDPDIALSLNNLAELFRTQGRVAEAEPLYKRALTIIEKARVPNHPDVARALHNLGSLYQAQGRFAEAEPLFKRALILKEAALPAGHPEIAHGLNNLAELFRAQGRFTEAEQLYKRALALYESGLPAGHRDIAASLNNLASLYQAQGRLAEAEPLFKRALAQREAALPAGHPDIGNSLNNLALLYRDQGRLAEAEPLYKRALVVWEAALPPGHPLIATGLNNLAFIYQAEGRTAEAEVLLKRALTLFEAALPPGHLHVAANLNNLAALHFTRRDWALSVDYWRRSTKMIVDSAERGSAEIGQALTGKRKVETERLNFQFQGLVKAVHRLVGHDGGSNATALGETFVTAQWALGSEAAGSLAQMAARGAKGDTKLAVLVRERQDLVEEWQTRDAVRTAAVSQPSDKRDTAAETANVARLAAIDARIAEIDKRLVAEFPDYAALARPTPLTVEDAQAQLGANEVLVLFLDTPERKPTPEETFIWVITKKDVRWVKSELGTPSLTREVSALRCGLDAAAWEDDGTAKCAGLLRVAPNVNAPLPFDVARAHGLYQTLFGQVEDLIKDKHLLIVPSGPLTSLPFQVLVTAAPTHSSQVGGEYRSAAWVINRHTITVLPSVASLKSLRQFAKTSRATQPFIGFGNPLLVGPSGTDKRAWARQSCPQAAPDSVQVASRLSRGETSRFFRGSLADVELIRSQAPLPETADELCAVARLVGALEGAVHLGDKATEATVKALSASGVLAQSRVVHFATHGLLASETGMVVGSKAEPALLLTPPASPTEHDDGLLTASEVTQLKLDADWVVLSACNTAAGGSDDLNAQALSGLARAFFYAGARALLVSHWAVDSDATVSLVTKAFDEIKADRKLGRAEALRRSMLALIASGDRHAHPASWAPFVVVGEGAGAR